MSRAVRLILATLGLAGCQDQLLEPVAPSADEPLFAQPQFAQPEFAKGGNGGGVSFEFDPVEQKFFWIGFVAPEGDTRFCDVHYFVPEGGEGQLQTFKDGSQHLRTTDAPVARVRIVHEGSVYWSEEGRSGTWSANLWFNAWDQVTNGHFVWSGPVTPAAGGGIRIGTCDLNVASGGFFSRAEISVAEIPTE